MPYSIGNSPLEVIRGDTNGALGALGNAYQMMSKGMDKLSEAPNNAYNWLQDTADARYNEALNRYANAPEGLAQALQNGSINTANVRASTLGQTQDKLKDIAMNRYLNYSYDQTKKSNDWFNANQDIVGQYATAYQTGDLAKVQALREEAARRGVDSTNFKYFQNNAMEQRNKETEFGLERQRIAASNSGNALAWQKYYDDQQKADVEARLIQQFAHLGAGRDDGHGNKGKMTFSQILEVASNPKLAKNYNGRDFSELSELVPLAMKLGIPVLDIYNGMTKYGNNVTKTYPTALQQTEGVTQNVNLDEINLVQ